MRTAILIFTASIAWGGESPIPTAPPSERYAQMSRHSPFALATVVAPVAPLQASFAANWFVSGIGRLNDTDFVSIQARDLSAQFSLFGHEANRQNDVSLVEVQWSEVIGKSTVVLRKGGEVARLEFNEATVRGPSTAATSAGTPVGFAGKPPGGTPKPLPNIAPPVAISTAPAPIPESAAANFHRRIRPLSTPR